MTNSPADSAARRTQLREFLTSRRSRISPADAGLAAGGRRRTPGLRREEVAVLAGVSVSWYQWLEQGREISVSPQVLDAVARTLRLDDAERRHLYVLAGLNPPIAAGSPARPLDARLTRLVESLMPMPAMIRDRYWNLCDYNDAAQRVFDISGPEHNGLACFFTNHAFRSCVVDWTDTARRLVGQFRGEMSEHVGDPGFTEVVRQLSAVSPDFVQMWERHDVGPGGFVRKTYQHPLVGRLEFEITQLRVSGLEEFTVVLDNPAAGTETAARIDALLQTEPAPLRVVG